MSFLLVLLATTLLDEREKRHQTQFLDSSSIIYPEISPTSIGFQSEEFGGEYISPRGFAPVAAATGIGSEPYGGSGIQAAEPSNLGISPIGIPTATVLQTFAGNVSPDLTLLPGQYLAPIAEPNPLFGQPGEPQYLATTGLQLVQEDPFFTEQARRLLALRAARD